MPNFQYLSMLLAGTLYQFPAQEKDFFFFMATLVAYGNDTARDGIRAAAVIYAIAAATPDSLTRCTSQGSNLCLPRNPSCCSRILNLLRHSGNYRAVFVLFCLVFLGPHLRHMEVTRLGVESEL